MNSTLDDANLADRPLPRKPVRLRIRANLLAPSGHWRLKLVLRVRQLDERSVRFHRGDGAGSDGVA